MDRLPPDDAVLREFVADLYAAFSRMRMLRRAIARTVNLSSAEYSVLLGVWYLERRGETTVSALANHLHVAAAHTTAEVGKLVKLGLLIKTPHSKDRRAVGIKLSCTGYEIFQRLSLTLRQINDHLFEGIHYADMVVVHRFFQRIIEQMPASLHVAESHVDTETGARPRQRL